MNELNDLISMLKEWVEQRFMKLVEYDGEVVKSIEKHGLSLYGVLMELRKRIHTYARALSALEHSLRASDECVRRGLLMVAVDLLRAVDTELWAWAVSKAPSIVSARVSINSGILNAIEHYAGKLVENHLQPVYALERGSP